jgi:acyl carrier protein
LVVPNTETLVRSVLDEVFALGGSAMRLRPEASLHAILPQLDSMAATAVITLIEERLAVTVEPGDITGSDFESLGSLIAAVTRLHRPPPS